MRVIGLTGGIACGKSNVSSAMREAGVAVVDADEISRSLTAENGPALPAIRAAFGNEVFSANGTLNRKALGNLVFHNANALKQLNRIVHPMIDAEVRKRLKQLQNSGEKLCILDVPLLYETGMNRLCDTVWCVTLPRREQIKRLMVRDGLSRKQALARIHSQYPGWLRTLRSPVRISSLGTHEETQKKALLHLQKEKQKLQLV